MTEAKIEIDEINLEDAIVLGNDKLVNISIEYPRENEDGDVIETVKTRAKIKQLTMKKEKLPYLQPYLYKLWQHRI